MANINLLRQGSWYILYYSIPVAPFDQINGNLTCKAGIVIADAPTEGALNVGSE